MTGRSPLFRAIFISSNKAALLYARFGIHYTIYVPMEGLARHPGWGFWVPSSWPCGLKLCIGYFEFVYCIGLFINLQMYHNNLSYDPLCFGK